MNGMNMTIIIDRMIANTTDPHKLIELLTARMVRTIDPATRLTIKQQIEDLKKSFPINGPSAKDCFAHAINAGILSADPASPNFAGHYMYMGMKDADTGSAALLFKHIGTREYLAPVKMESNNL